MLGTLSTAVLVVVGKLHIVRAVLFPHETEAVLIIDPDAVLPRPAVQQGLQTVPRRRPKIGKLNRGIHLIQLTSHYRCDVAPSPILAGKE